MNASTIENDGSTLILNIPTNKIRAFADQPRKYFDPETLKGLADSMREVGQVTPGLVIKLNPSVNGYEYELVEGERRLRACHMVGIKFFRAEIDTGIKNSDDQFEKSVTANFNRDGHPPIECARAIDRLKRMGRSEARIGIIMGGRSTTWVRQHYSILRLQPETQALMDPSLPSEQQLTFNIAVQLIDVSREYQIELAKTITSMRLGIKEAAHLIHKTLHSHGRVNARSNQKQFAALIGFVSRTTTQFDQEIGLEDAHLKAILKSKTLQDRMLLAERTEDLIKKIQSFRSKVKRCLTDI